MRKIFSVIIAAALTSGSVAAYPVTAEGVKESIIYDGLEYIAVNDQLLLEGAVNKMVMSVDIPAQIDGRNVFVADGAFSDCPYLTYINVDDASTELEDVGGVLFSKDGTILLEYPRGRAGEYQVPSGTEMIGVSAFENAAGLTYVHIPDSVTSVGFYAFRGCTSLTGFNALPLTSSGEAIRGCTSLKRLVLADMPEKVHLVNLKLDDLPELQSIVIPDSYILTDGFTLRNCPKVTELVFPEEADLRQLIIYSCDALTSVSLPTSYKGNYNSVNIANCGSLSHIELDSDKLTSLALRDMPALTELRLDNAYHSFECNIDICASLEAIRQSAEVVEYNIDSDTCPALKDYFYYSSSATSIRLDNAKRLSGLGVTIHIRKSNTALQSFLTDNGVSYVFIEDETLYGDANCDGAVNMADAVLIMQSVSDPGKYPLSAEKKLNADVIGDDGVTNNDALAVQQYEAGIVAELPVDA